MLDGISLGRSHLYDSLRTEFAAVGLGCGILETVKGRTATAKAHFETSRQIDPALLRRVASLVGITVRHFGPAGRGVPLVFPPDIA